LGLVYPDDGHIGVFAISRTDDQVVWLAKCHDNGGNRSNRLVGKLRVLLDERRVTRRRVDPPRGQEPGRQQAEENDSGRSQTDGSEPSAAPCPMELQLDPADQGGRHWRQLHDGTSQRVVQPFALLDQPPARSTVLQMCQKARVFLIGQPATEKAIHQFAHGIRHKLLKQD
jgi:hypothetical protein